jgi:hypothetical protein
MSCQELDDVIQRWNRISVRLGDLTDLSKICCPATVGVSILVIGRYVDKDKFMLAVCVVARYSQL